MQNLHETRHGATYRFAIARVEVRAHCEVVVDDLRVVVLAKVAKRLSEVVDDETVVISEVLVVHLRHLPTWQVEVEPVYECHVIANDVRHLSKQMARLHHDIDWLPSVAEHGNAGVAGHGLLASLKLPRLTIGFSSL